MAECNCCAFWAISFLGLCETGKEAVKHSDYDEAKTIASKYGISLIRKLKGKCQIDTGGIERRMDEVIRDIAEAETAHQETTFSPNALSKLAEAEFSGAAQARFDSLIFELHNAVRKRARELNCEL